MESIKKYVIKDSHGNIKQQGALSVVGAVNIEVDGDVGTPTADAVYENGVLTITLHDIKGERGNGITDIEVDEQEGDEAVNTVTFKTTDNPEGTSFHIKNGSRGTGIADITEEYSDEDGGTNTITIMLDDGTTFVVHTKNGHTGAQGATVHYDAATDVVIDVKMGQSELMGMTQKSITDAFMELNEYDVTDDTDYTAQDCSIGSGKWYKVDSGNQSHFVIPVKIGEVLKICPMSETSSTVFYAYLTSSYNPPYSNNSSMPLVSGTSRMTMNVNTINTVTIPNNCAYLALNLVDGADNSATYKIYRGDSIVEKVSNIEKDVASNGLFAAFNTDNISLLGWYIRTASQSPAGTWFQSNDYQGKLIDVSSMHGHYLRIVRRTQSSVFRIAFLHSDNKSSNVKADFCNGTYIEDLSVAEVIRRIPDDAAYLYVYAYSSGSIVEPYIYTVNNNLVGMMDDRECPVKIRIAHWNIGHFALGQDKDTHITHEEYPTMRQKWAEALNEIGADFMLLTEYNTNIVNAAGGESAITAKDSVFSQYQYQNEGDKFDYVMEAVMSNMPLRDIKTVFYSGGTTGRYYYCGYLDIAGKTIAVVATHLDFDNSTSRANQINRLISDFSDMDYVIIGADFNVSNAAEYDAFAAAGYQMANHGYLGNIKTYPAGNNPTSVLDNIVCKGFAVNGIRIVNDNTLTDHCAIYADFTLIR